MFSKFTVTLRLTLAQCCVARKMENIEKNYLRDQ